MIRGDAIEVSLPEKVDVCVSEVVGSIGGSEAAAYVLNQARRFLAEGGVMIPERSVTRIAAVTMPENYMRSPSFSPAHRELHQEDLRSESGAPFDLRKICPKERIDGEPDIDLPAYSEDLDFRAEVPLESAHLVCLTINRDARLDGFLVWLNLQTHADCCIDILRDRHCWLPVFLPVFDNGVSVTMRGPA